jgi:hypothetical protein
MEWRHSDCQRPASWVCSEFPVCRAQIPRYMEVNVKLFSMVSTAKLIVVCLVCAGCCVQMRAQGHGPGARDQYSVASVCGDYSAVATYGPNIARALGFEVMDGHGNIRGAATVNQPGSDNSTRSITRTRHLRNVHGGSRRQREDGLEHRSARRGFGECERGFCNHEDEDDQWSTDCDGDRRHAGSADRGDR